MKPPDTTKAITSPFGRPDLRARRLALGLSARQLARLCGYRTPGVVIQLERGTYHRAGIYPARTLPRVLRELARLEAARALTPA